MNQNRWPQYLGALFLIGAGLIFLLQNLGLLPNLTALLWGLLLLAGGMVFLVAFLAGRAHWWTLLAAAGMGGSGLVILLDDVLHLRGDLPAAVLFACLTAAFAAIYRVRPRENWWAIIPGAVMAILAVALLISSAAGGELVGVILFLGLGLAFVALYFAEINGTRQNWWALIPAGALLSLAVVVLLSTYFPRAGSLAGSALFLGLGVTFGVLYLLRGPGRPLEWAWIPSVALLGFGVFILAVAGEYPYARLFWPLALVIGGVVLLFRSRRKLLR